MSVRLIDAVKRTTPADGVVRSYNPSLADTPREDGKPWVVTRIPEVSQAEKARITKKNGKI